MNKTILWTWFILAFLWLVYTISVYVIEEGKIQPTKQEKHMDDILLENVND